MTNLRVEETTLSTFFTTTSVSCSICQEHPAVFGVTVVAVAVLRPRHAMLASSQPIESTYFRIVIGILRRVRLLPGWRSTRTIACIILRAGVIFRDGVLLMILGASGGVGWWYCFPPTIFLRLLKSFIGLPSLIYHSIRFR